MDMWQQLGHPTHLNLLEDVTPPVQLFDAASNIPSPPTSIHDVELQYAEYEDVDPFEDI